jgi:hypothetical protein
MADGQNRREEHMADSVWHETEMKSFCYTP